MRPKRSKAEAVSAHLALNVILRLLGDSLLLATEERIRAMRAAEFIPCGGDADTLLC
jgi:hypothetical protein